MVHVTESIISAMLELSTDYEFILKKSLMKVTLHGLFI
jgi:hypothetical protein